MLGVGEVLPFSPTRRRAASLPVDVARTIEQALATLALDVVNVHEPFAPSASSVALRHSRALSVGSFHSPTERVLSTQLTRPLSRLLFARMDARTASYAATRNLLQRFFPGEYRVIMPGRRSGGSARGQRGARAGADRDRGAGRGAHVPAGAAAAARRSAVARDGVVAPARGAARHARAAAARPRVVRRRRRSTTRARRWRGPTSPCWPPTAIARRPGTLVRALGSGAVVVASRLPVYEEVLAQGDRGLMFEPGEVRDAGRASAEPGRRPAAAARAARPSRASCNVT